ncbi:MAG: response regulator [Calothrix sp. C42_A2020_038]|nr:response regulator [Calothrix sp. C42_A2020_038]
MKILVVEDDELIVQSLVHTLAQSHHIVDTAGDGISGWEFTQVSNYDLIVLDVMLPKLDGISLCRRLRSRGINVPIVLLTAQDNSTNKIIGLDAGADDYITKPFDLQELTARIRALLRRGSTVLQTHLQWENLRLDPNICEVTYNNKLIRLTPKEYSLLELFLRNPARTFSSGAIIDHLWSLEETPGEDTVRAHMKGLRQKLKAAGVVKNLIENVYGIGYRLKSFDDSQNKKKSKSKSQKEKTIENIETTNSEIAPSQTTGAIKHSPQIAAIWERSQEKLSNRVATLETATAALLQDSTDTAIVNRAYQDAHKLAGSLGMFGFDFASRLASQIEQLLQPGISLAQEQKLNLSELVVALRSELKQVSTHVNSTGASTKLKSAQEKVKPVLLIVHQDNSLVSELAVQAISRGVELQKAANPQIARELIAQRRPDVVVLDLISDREDGLKLLAEVNCFTPSIPVLVLTDQDNFIDRVQITRLGGQAFVHNPKEPVAIIEAVTGILQQSPNSMVRVLIVDDDTEVLNMLVEILKPWGLEITTLEEPLKFWDALKATAPDLLVLDVEMPSLSGIELCKVLRNDPQYSGLPVLFLTAHSSPDIMRRVFAAGADDFIKKPVVGPEIVARILNRIERTRLLRNFAQIDPLTGLANRQKSTVEINKILKEAERQNQPLCLAVLRITNLQQINAQYGHNIGDKVLSLTAKVLHNTFSKQIVSRWAGAEFVLCLYPIELDYGNNVLCKCIGNIIQKTLNIHKDKQVRVFINMGMSQQSQDGTNLATLYQTAMSRCTR